MTALNYSYRKSFAYEAIVLEYKCKLPVSKWLLKLSNRCLKELMFW